MGGGGGVGLFNFNFILFFFFVYLFIINIILYKLLELKKNNRRRLIKITNGLSLIILLCDLNYK